MITDYATRLQSAAAEKVAPLAEKVKRLSRDLAKIDDRMKAARDDLARADEAISGHKGRAVEKLTSSTSAYHEWQGRLRRLMLEKDSQIEALALMQTEIRPQAARDLDAARAELRRAVLDVTAGAKREAEKKMAECVGMAVDVRAAYLDAARQFFADYNQGWTGESSDHDRLYPSPQVLRYKDAGYCTVYFLDNRPVETMLIPPHLRPLPPGAPGPETPQDAPQAAPPTTPDAVRASDDAPVNVLAVQDGVPAAQDAPGAMPTPALDPLPCPDVPTTDRPATCLTGDVADLDAQDCAAVDADYFAGLDVPPDAGKENPGIAAEGG